jgi:uroporphyrinogen decarboxylase
MVATMTSKERVRAAFARTEPDRVPVNYLYNAGIDRRLKAHYGLSETDDEGLRLKLGVDFRSLGAHYAGPKLFEDVPDRQVDVWGVHKRWIEHESGGYWDYCDFPLKDATLADVEAWPMPSPDDFDYSYIEKHCREYADYAIIIGGAGIGDNINQTGMLRTMEQTLVDLAIDEPAGLRYMDRRVELMVEVMRRALEAAHGCADLLYIGEDLGTQQGALISLDMFRKHIRPRLQKYVDVGKAANVPVMIHSCGSSSWAFEDFIEMGITIVDTLQPEAANMAPAYLKETYGTRLAFHGCISTAGPVAKGSVEDVVRDVRRTLDVMMPGGGYALAPTHQLQDNSKVENVVAMYEAAREYGTY